MKYNKFCKIGGGVLLALVVTSSHAISPTMLLLNTSTRGAVNKTNQGVLEKYSKVESPCYFKFESNKHAFIVNIGNINQIDNDGVVYFMNGDISSIKEPRLIKELEKFKDSCNGSIALENKNNLPIIYSGKKINPKKINIIELENKKNTTLSFSLSGLNNSKIIYKETTYQDKGLHSMTFEYGKDKINEIWLQAKNLNITTQKSKSINNKITK